MEKQAPDPSKYSLRVDPADLRARYGPVRVGPADVPFDRPYEQLTPEQQHLFSRGYERMEQGDEPPYPLAGLQAIYKPLGEAQAVVGVSGILFLEVVVDSHGIPQETRVYKAPNPRVAKAASEIAMLVRFKPALCSGRPCRMNFPVSASFGLR